MANSCSKSPNWSTIKKKKNFTCYQNKRSGVVCLQSSSPPMAWLSAIIMQSYTHFHEIYFLDRRSNSNILSEMCTNKRCYPTLRTALRPVLTLVFCGSISDKHSWREFVGSWQKKYYRRHLDIIGWRIAGWDVLRPCFAINPSVSPSADPANSFAVERY